MAQNGVLKPSLTLQMAAGYSAYIPKLYATQTDNESIDVSVKLMDKTMPYVVPEGYQVNLRAKKPDGTVVFQALAKNGEFYVLKLGGQLTTAVGIVDAAVEVVKGSFVLNSARFEVDVKPRTVNDGDIASEDDLTALNEYVERSETAAEQAEESAQTAVNAADRAQAAADQADQAVQSIGTATEDVKKAADSAALSASSAAQSAMEAGQSKTDAGKSAENAAASATAAAQSAAAASQSEKAAGQAAGSASQSALAASNSAQTASDKAGETKTSAQDASDAAQAASSAQTAAESAKTAAETAKGQAETQAGNAAQSAQEASASASAAAESAAQAAASAEQADLAIKTAIKLTKTGELVSITDSIEYPFVGLTVYGKSTQDGTPSPDNPVPIVSAGDSGEIEAKVYGGNLISSDISSWNSNGWGTSNDTVLQLSDGIKIKAISGWRKVYYDTSEMNGKTLNFSFDYQQIESETTSPDTDAAFAVVRQDENMYPIYGSDDFIFNINSPQTVKTHVSVSFTARNYLCFFLHVNTEGVEVGETRAIEVTNIMLNAGNTELTYEPYKTPQSIVLSTPNSLPGIPVDSGGNYTDASGQRYTSDCKECGAGKYIQQVGRVTDWAIREGPQGGYFLRATNYPDGNPKNRGKVITTVASKIAQNNLWEAKGPEPYTFAQRNSYDGVIIWPGDQFQDAGTIQNLIDSKQVEAYYELAIPIETPLSEEEIAAYRALHLYHPNTNVFGTDNVGLKAQYVADTELFVNNLLADIASLHAVQDAGLGL